MFSPDVLRYAEFYASPLGSVVQRVLSLEMKNLWKTHQDHRMLGIGYALPCLNAFDGHISSLWACMPAAQGVIHWPSREHNQTFLADEGEIPLPNDSINALILMHVLEHSYYPQALLNEAWRVLAPGGRLCILVPNRRGIWARLDHTPFGHGRPFSRPQLRQSLEERRFTQRRHGTLLFTPPTENRVILRYHRVLEILGTMLLPMCGGLLWMEAEKQVYAIHGHKMPTSKRPSYLTTAPAAGLQGA